MSWLRRVSVFNDTPARDRWERFTGSDIAYAPDSLRLDPASPTYAAFRSQTRRALDPAENLRKNEQTFG